MRNKQAELIKNMTSDQLKQQLLLSQLLLLVVGLIVSIFLFDSLTQWYYLVSWAPANYLWYGLIPGLIVVLIDVVLMNLLPKHYYDDGGINEKIFQHQTIGSILIICLVIAISEEMLFRGVIQTTFGYFIASFVFAIVHIRYLFKPVLLVSVLLLSFYLGYLFEVTNNLMVTIIAHFTIDLLLALIIRYKAEVNIDGSR